MGYAEPYVGTKEKRIPRLRSNAASRIQRMALKPNPGLFSIVIAREGGRSSTPRAASSGTASLRPPPCDYWMPRRSLSSGRPKPDPLAGHDSREAYVRGNER